MLRDNGNGLAVNILSDGELNRLLSLAKTKTARITALVQYLEGRGVNIDPENRLWLWQMCDETYKSKAKKLEADIESGEVARRMAA